MAVVQVVIMESRKGSVHLDCAKHLRVCYKVPTSSTAWRMTSVPRQLQAAENNHAP